MKMNSIIEEKNEGMKIFIPKIFSPKQAESEKVRRVSESKNISASYTIYAITSY
jgi:hypothetical protein